MAISLKKNSGLDIEFNLHNRKLVFNRGISNVKPAVRKLSQMQGVVLDNNLRDPERELYYMYRGIHKVKDNAEITTGNLRYDITIINPGFLGDEFVKTAGHYHVGAYPELYEILWGEALCLMQRSQQGAPSKIEDVILVKAKAKEKIVVLPNYGHVLINPSIDSPLVVANWIASDCKSDYSLHQKAGGAAYFITNDDGEFKFLKNDHFAHLPQIRVVRPAAYCYELGLSLDEPVYNIIERLEKLEFLKFPEKYNYKSCFIDDRSLFAAIPL